jgi:Porin PorA
VPQLTTDVGLTYTYEGTTTYWVEPSTGAVVDMQSEEVRRVGVQLPGGPSVPPSITVYDVSLAMTEASVRQAAAGARDDRDALRLYGRTLPLVLTIVGTLGVLAAILVAVTRPPRRQP